MTASGHSIRRTFWLTALASMACLGLMASKAQASPYAAVVPFCGNYNPATGYYTPQTLKPGQICGFWPVAVAAMNVRWDVTTSTGSGRACVGVVRYPPGWPNGTMLSPSGAPGPPRCEWIRSDWRSVGMTWVANNGFGAVYGQPVMINYSTATIKTRPDHVDTYLTYYP